MFSIFYMTKQLKLIIHIGLYMHTIPSEAKNIAAFIIPRGTTSMGNMSA